MVDDRLDLPATGAFVTQMDCDLAFVWQCDPHSGAILCSDGDVAGVRSGGIKLVN
ncbi:hypothetical protein PA08_0696 [Cutibacterium modestum P08]|uniref:Uncharacterized protein n=1 Tax=Cutibacterium modestum TaxID=2559073 RepID=A0AAD1KP05_9ACTN|nr:hypothetical protein PA08_0696 [Cutibacterium modestum P08]BCY24737.1 hypothetical protein KB1_07270 [Cutibacterium modestum]